jgi:Zn-dependent oligopeptidase
VPVWAPGQAGALVRTLTEAHTRLPLEPTERAPRWHGGFRHLAGYAAGYYTYLWAQSISQRVWHSAFAAEPLRREAGERWCDEVLRHGGAREPREMLRAMMAGDRGRGQRTSADETHADVSHHIGRLVDLERKV